ncbi:amidohydrolase family protein [Pedobacter duraquae]|uniref:amidohydrolase family protein n=1 Tax=Pedobacter duraquae TaxID=425511 RepID=UPI00105C86E5|nr:amidohydrolase family protein [Pedobacter duraquae]
MKINLYFFIEGASCLQKATHPLRPSEAISREDAVIAYTLTSAYAEFAEQNKGSLVFGKVADLVVLSQDIFKVPVPQLLQTESLLTIIDGKIVYDKLDYKIFNP